MILNSNTSLSMYLFCNSRIHVITLYSGHVCVYYASMLRCWHFVWILVRTDHPCLGVGCHTGVHSWINLGFAKWLGRSMCGGERQRATEIWGKMNFTRETDLPGRGTMVACGGWHVGEPFL
jgi:hypothetical protein